MFHFVLFCIELYRRYLNADNLNIYAKHDGREGFIFNSFHDCIGSVCVYRTHIHSEMKIIEEYSMKYGNIEWIAGTWLHA